MRAHERHREKGRERERPTRVDVSFMLFQGVLALEPFPTALCFTDEPGVSFTGFLVLLKAAQIRKKTPRERRGRSQVHNMTAIYFIFTYTCVYITWIQS